MRAHLERLSSYYRGSLIEGSNYSYTVEPLIKRQFGTAAYRMEGNFRGGGFRVSTHGPALFALMGVVNVCAIREYFTRNFFDSFYPRNFNPAEISLHPSGI